MRALSLFLFRACLAMFLLACAGLRFASPVAGLDVAGGLYIEAFGDPAFQYVLGVICGTLGVCVLLGLLRPLVYPVVALMLAANAALMSIAVMTPLALQPFDMIIAFEALKTLVPALAMFLLALAPLVWWHEDAIALDRIPSRKQQYAADGSSFIDFPIERDDVVKRGPAYRAAALASAHMQKDDDLQPDGMQQDDMSAEQQAHDPYDRYAPSLDRPIYGEQMQAQYRDEHRNGELYAEEISEIYVPVEPEYPSAHASHEHQPTDMGQQETVAVTMPEDSEENVLQLEIAEAETDQAKVEKHADPANAETNATNEDGEHRLPV